MNTSLITFEGRVAMSDISRDVRDEHFDQRKLERTVSNERAVMVEHGQVSAINLNLSDRAMLPTLLGVKQVEALKKNEFGVKESSEVETKQFRNPIPPGADGVSFSNVVTSENHAVVKAGSEGFSITIPVNINFPLDRL